MEGLAVLATFRYEAPSYGTLETERERERERERESCAQERGTALLEKAEIRITSQGGERKGQISSCRGEVA